MANDNGLRSFIDSYVLENVDDELQSSFIQTNPMLYFLAGQAAENLGKLGSGSTSVVLGTGGMGRAERKDVSGDKEHQFRFQVEEPDDGGTVEKGGATPTATGFAEDRVKTAATRWTHYMEPMKIREHSMLMAGNSKVKLGKLVEEAVGQTVNAMLKRINTGLRYGSPSAVEQERELWPQFIGTRHALTKNNHAYRRDRSVETWLNPVQLTAEEVLGAGNTGVDLKIARILNVGNGSFQGLARRSKTGKGATLFVTTPELWLDLADQIDGVGQIFHSGIPGRGVGGFEQPIIQYDRYYFISDEEVAEGEMECFNLDTWLFEVHRDLNFKIPNYSEWTKKWRVQEGGEYYRFTNMELMARLTCRRPWDNARITGLTVNG